MKSFNRRTFLKQSALATGAMALGPQSALSYSETKLEAKADSMILIWLPGGISQFDTWDPKEYTPYEKGMKGSEMMSTFRKIPTAADGIHLCEGLETIASVMDKGTIL